MTSGPRSLLPSSHCLPDPLPSSSDLRAEVGADLGARGDLVVGTSTRFPRNSLRVLWALTWLPRREAFWENHKDAKTSLVWRGCCFSFFLVQTTCRTEKVEVNFSFYPTSNKAGFRHPPPHSEL